MQLPPLDVLAARSQRRPERQPMPRRAQVLDVQRRPDGSIVHYVASASPTPAGTQASAPRAAVRRRRPPTRGCLCCQRTVVSGAAAAAARGAGAVSCERLCAFVQP